MTVLILVRDLGFQFWLAGILAEAGFAVAPATTPTNAANLMAELSQPVDLAIVDPALAESADFVIGLRNFQGYLHILPVTTEPAENRESVPEESGAEHSAQTEPMSATDWTNLVRGVFSQAATAR